MIKKQVAVIGAGPVGLIATLFLHKYGYDYSLIEKRTGRQSHPAAHLINLRSMEIMSELGIENRIFNQTENIEYFRYYRYMRRILDDDHFAIQDHFEPNPVEKQREINNYAFSKYIHLPQHKFVELLHDEIDDIVEKQQYINNDSDFLRTTNRQLLFGTDVLNIDNKEDGVELKLKDLSTEEEYNMKVDFVVACDGFHSRIRSQQGLNLIGNPCLQNFLNIYFNSIKLAESISQKNQNAMLHFVYNSEITGCLINHTKREGTFVLQVPVFPPYSDFYYQKYSKEESDLKSLNIINKLLSKRQQLQQKDIEIKNVGIWGLSSQIIERFYQKRIIFAGDSAHSFPPAGGFGMNAGIQDIYNLIHKLNLIYTFDKKQQILMSSNKINNILSKYSEERKFYSNLISTTAMKYYYTSLEIPRRLGMSYENLLTFKKAVDLISGVIDQKLSKQIFQLGLKAGSMVSEIHPYHKQKIELNQKQNLIPMIFYQEDTQYQFGTQSLIDNDFQDNLNLQSDQKNQSYNCAGMLLPHAYLKIFNKNNEEIQVSTRQVSYMIYDQKIQPDSSFSSIQNKKQKNENRSFIIVFYLNSKWQDKLEQLAKYINNKLEINIQNVFGISLGINFDQITQDPINKFTPLFKNLNEILVVRSDSIIIGKYPLNLFQ